MKIVTAIYELFKGRGLGHYRSTDAAYIKGLSLMPKGDDLHYVVYTDAHTYNRYKVQFDKAVVGKNVDIRLFELPASEYHPNIQSIITDLKKENADYYETVDKHSAVFGYTELMVEKFNMVANAITEDDEVAVWMDVGLFLNSCNFPWRPWVETNCYTHHFMDRLKEVCKDSFLLFQSHQMAHFYLYADVLREEAGGGTPYIISGGLWGGNAQKTKALCREMAQNAHTLHGRRLNVSDQECLSLSVMKDPTRFQILEFGDWYDYQIVFLKILGVYDPQTYNKDTCTL